MRKHLFLLAMAATLTAHAQDLQLNDREYFERRGVNVLVFSNSFNGGFNDEKNSGIDNYHHLGDAASITDGLHYDPSLRPYEVSADGKSSGTPDDMWAFTTRNPSLDLQAARVFTSAARVLRGYNNALANRAQKQANRIADGHFDEPLPESQRHDSVGRLQNSFILMQQSLAQTINDIRLANDELERNNDELARAYQLKIETNRRKAAFIQEMYHQIRTPLNIISGFAQVLAASLHGLPPDEVEDITTRMKESATDISRLARQLEDVAGDGSVS